MSYLPKDKVLEAVSDSTVTRGPNVGTVCLPDLLRGLARTIEERTSFTQSEMIRKVKAEKALAFWLGGPALDGKLAAFDIILDMLDDAEETDGY